MTFWIVMYADPKGKWRVSAEHFNLLSDRKKETTRRLAIAMKKGWVCPRNFRSDYRVVKVVATMPRLKFGRTT